MISAQNLTEKKIIILDCKLRYVSICNYNTVQINQDQLLTTTEAIYNKQRFVYINNIVRPPRPPLSPRLPIERGYEEGEKSEQMQM